MVKHSHRECWALRPCSINVWKLFGLKIWVIVGEEGPEAARGSAFVSGRVSPRRSQVQKPTCLFPLAALGWTPRMLLLKDQTFISSHIPAEGGGDGPRLVFLSCARARRDAHAGPCQSRAGDLPSCPCPPCCCQGPRREQDCDPRTSPAPTGCSRGLRVSVVSRVCPGRTRPLRKRVVSGSDTKTRCLSLGGRGGVFRRTSAEVTHLGPERVNTVHAARSSPSAFLRPRRRVPWVVKASGTASALRERRRLPGVPPPRPGRPRFTVTSPERPGRGGTMEPEAARGSVALRSVPRKRLHVL